MFVERLERMMKKKKLAIDKIEQNKINLFTNIRMTTTAVVRLRCCGRSGCCSGR